MIKKKIRFVSFLNEEKSRVKGRAWQKKSTLIWAEQNISADMKVFLTLKKGRESTINVLHN